MRAKLTARSAGIKAAVKDALHRGLHLLGVTPRPKPFSVRPHSFGFKTGIDLDRINHLVDHLDSVETARKLPS